MGLIRLDKFLSGQMPQVSRSDAARLCKKGEIKVNPLTDDNKRFFDLKRVVIGGAEYSVASARVTPAGVFIKLTGIDDRNAAELLRGKDVEAAREDVPEVFPAQVFH